MIASTDSLAVPVHGPSDDPPTPEGPSWHGW